MIPRAVFVRPEAAAEPLVAAARAALPGAEFLITAADACEARPELAPWQILVLDRFRGGLVKELAPAECSFPGRTEAYLVCGVNCPGRCGYCFLQACASVPYPVFYANLDAMVAELDAALARSPEIYLHLGHILDPLAYPFLGPLLEAFVRTVARVAGATLEIRTKFTAIDMLPAAPAPNVVVALSLAPPRVAKLYEQGTPGVEARLRALALLAERKWRIGVRLDPVLLYDGWEPDYTELCERIVGSLPPAAVADVVLGTLRGPPELIARIRADDRADLLRRGEFVRIGGGKLGYARPMRIRALRFLAERLGNRYPLRFCFEPEEVVAEMGRGLVTHTDRLPSKTDRPSGGTRASSPPSTERRG